MEQNMEVELKLCLTDAKLYSDVMISPIIVSLAEGAVWQSQLLESYYFDTPDNRLRDKQLAYRVRCVDGRYVATVKGMGTSGGGLHQRQEWNVDVARAEPDIAVFKETEIGAALRAAVGNERIAPLFVTKFERHTLMVHTGEEAWIEIALDRGEMVAGERRAPILELELELKKGKPASLLKLGAALARDYPLLLEARSKYLRALQLAGIMPEEEKPVTSSDWRKDIIYHIHKLLELQQAMAQEKKCDVRRSISLLLELWAEALG